MYGLYVKTGGSLENPQGAYSRVAAGSVAGFLPERLAVTPGTLYECEVVDPDGTKTALAWEKAAKPARVYRPEWTGTDYPPPVLASPLHREKGTWTLTLEACVFGATRVACYSVGGPADDPSSTSYELVEAKSVGVPETNTIALNTVPPSP
jgi:hypothetical protein